MGIMFTGANLYNFKLQISNYGDKPLHYNLIRLISGDELDIMP